MQTALEKVNFIREGIHGPLDASLALTSAIQTAMAGRVKAGGFMYSPIYYS
jgi:hypothetical protein